MINLNELVSGAYRNRLFWLLQSAGWLGVTVMALVFTTITYASWSDAFWLTLFRTSYGVTVTCAMRLVYRRMRKNWCCPRKIGLTAFFLCGLVGVVEILLTLGLGHTIGVDMQGSESGFFADLTHFFLASLLMRWVVYWFWTVLYFVINYWLETQRVKMELAEAEAAVQASELKALRAQVNPHFLFNALGSILAESENPSTVRVLTLALSDYLRFSLQRHRDLEPLAVELCALENYLRVEQARFEENLEYQINADDAALKSLAPNALVQPLLENAIKYGQRSPIRPLRLKINAAIEGDQLIVTVINSGEWVPPESNFSTKTGLANLRRRLQLMYGNRARLDVFGSQGEVTARVHLPVTPAEWTEPSLIAVGAGS